MIEAKIWERTRQVYRTVVKASRLSLILSEEARNTGRPLRYPPTTEAILRILSKPQEQNENDNE